MADEVRLVAMRKEEAELLRAKAELEEGEGRFPTVVIPIDLAISLADRFSEAYELPPCGCTKVAGVLHDCGGGDADS